eukprot:TRINITY_DN12258_c0_g1_i1.p1 TRINITY_DN12258_c0_g1~~TRINITY_DN12258_c0_g1_i1.p1  ORF type:complete len:235 (-),score=31.45 TRINITY_DN12258_c0_g1_i1:330-1034(-)
MRFLGRILLIFAFAFSVQGDGIMDKAKGYFESMSSPGGDNTICADGVCCPGSQCTPGFTTFFGCKDDRGMTECVAKGKMPLRNGVCRCFPGNVCGSGKCVPSTNTPGIQTAQGAIEQSPLAYGSPTYAPSVTEAPLTTPIPGLPPPNAAGSYSPQGYPQLFEKSGFTTHLEVTPEDHTFGFCVLGLAGFATVFATFSIGSRIFKPRSAPAVARSISRVSDDVLLEDAEVAGGVE